MPSPPTTILPAEWNQQQSAMLTWPHKKTDWLPYLTQVEPVFVKISREISLRQKLIITAFNPCHQAEIQQQLLQAHVNLHNVHFYCVKSDDSWVRDHGPITVLRNGKATLLDFTFNAWGDKFKANLDNQITRHLHAAGAFNHAAIETIDMVLEGGGIESDGKDTLLTTSTCLLSSTRNPLMDKMAIEQRLCKLFGLKRVLWLEHGHLAGDDTDSHIDTLARFSDVNSIIYVGCDDQDDPHYPALKAMELELQALRTTNGTPYTLYPLPWPSIKYNESGDKLPASYANFLIINEAVLVPTYDDEKDTQALACIQQAFPDRTIIDIPCLPLISQYGSLHCVTMQIPKSLHNDESSL